MLVGIDGPGVLIVGAPGEVFADTAVQLRRDLRRLDYGHAFVVGYANGWRANLPPAHAFPDGGYEVEWAQALGFAETLIDDLRRLAIAAAADHRPH